MSDAKSMDDDKDGVCKALADILHGDSVRARKIVDIVHGDLVARNDER